MKRVLGFVLACLIACALAACGTPRRQPPPDYEKVRQDHKKSQQDLRDEEDREDEEED